MSDYNTRPDKEGDALNLAVRFTNQAKRELGPAINYSPSDYDFRVSKRVHELTEEHLEKYHGLGKETT